MRPGGGTPTSVAVPAYAHMRTASTRPDGAVIAENAKSTPSGQLAHLRDRVAAGRVDRMRRTELERERELLRHHVHRDDRRRAREPRALHDREPDAAAADHRDRGALVHRRRPERGARAGREAAREEAGLVERQRVRHLDRARLVHDHAVGERAAAQHRAEPRVVGGAVHPAADAQVVRAAARVAATARATRVAARRAPRDDDAVAGCDTGDAFADLLDDARALVPEQDREAHAPAAGLDDVQVGVADAARLDPHLHLARADGLERDLLDRRPRARLGEDEAARHATARRSCSSSGTSGSLNVSTASVDVTTLSPSRSIVSWSRVTGAPGSFSVSSACSVIAANGNVDRRPPRAEHALQPVPELVPRRRVRAADLERAVRGGAEVDGAREVLGDVLDPDRLQALRAGADDRRHRREAREPDERRQRAAVLAEDEARPEDHVLDARTP